MNTCRKMERLMSRKLDGDLSAIEESELNEHRIRCGRCRLKLAEYERLRERLASHTLGTGARELYSALSVQGTFRSAPVRIAAIAAAFLVIAGISSMPLLMQRTPATASVAGIDSVDYHLTRFINAGLSGSSDKKLVYEPLESFVAFTSE